MAATTKPSTRAYGVVRAVLAVIALALAVVACQGAAPGATNPVQGVIADPGDREITPRPTVRPTPTPTPNPTPTPAPNQPPFLDTIRVDGRDAALHPPAVRPGQEVELQAAAGDPEGRPLSYSWLHGPEATVSATYWFYSTNRPVVLAKFRSLPSTIRLVVRDEHGASAERTVTFRDAS